LTSILRAGFQHIDWSEMAKRKSKQPEVEAKVSKKRGRSLAGLFVLAVIGAIAALVVSEPLRNKALDALFGAEEEFQYTPPVEPVDNGASAASQP